VLPSILEIVSILYGTVTMFAWGSGDFLAKRIVGDVGYYRLMLYVQLVYQPLLILLAALFTPSLPSSLETTVLLFVSGILGFSCVILFYKAISQGSASIVIPIYSTYSIVAIVLSFVLLGEILSPAQGTCVAVVLLGVLLVSLKPGSAGRVNVGAVYALGAMLFMGFNAVLFKLISIEIGGIGTLFFNRMLVLLISLIMFPFFDEPAIRTSGRASLRSILAVGLTQGAGISTFVIGLALGLVSVITPIANASPAVTVVLAYVFLKEKLVRIHKIGIAFIILGIVILSILSST